MLKTEYPSKYDIIWNDKHIYTENDSEYATFLKNLEGTYCLEGFYDAPCYVQKLKSDNDNSELSTGKRLPRSFDIAKRRDKFKENYEMKMKKISQALLQEKRQERVLKRKEGDIIKRRYNLNKSLQQFEGDVNTKKFQEELKLRDEADSFETNRKKFYSEKARIAKDRMRHSVNSHVDQMGKTRRSTLNLSKLTREYNAKKTEVDISSQEITNLMNEYEKKLAYEENRNRQLQKQLETISESLRMEMMKLKTQEEELKNDQLKEKQNKHKQDKEWENSYSSFVNTTDSGIKSAETQRKQLDSELGRVNENYAVKSCEYGGSLNTVRNQLHESENNQRKLIEQAKYLNLVMKMSEHDTKIENAAEKRNQLIQSRSQEVANENSARDNRYCNSLFQTQIDCELSNETDNVTHMKNSIRREKEMEQQLYKTMNDTSKDIKQQSILIGRLSKSLKQIEESTSARINEETRQYEKEKQTLADELKRERTRLTELQIKRDYHFNELVSYRKELSKDQKELERSKAHKTRLEGIKEKSKENNCDSPGKLPSINQ